MDNPIIENTGTIFRPGNARTVNNALVEEVSARNAREGFLLVSYAERGRFNAVNTRTLRLNIGRNTVLTNQSGAFINLREIRPGMRVTAVISPVMTQSIPPQSNAFIVVARVGEQIPRPPANLTSTARVLRVDRNENLLFTGDPFNINRQTVFAVNDRTVILDRRGNRVPLRFLRAGQRVEITHANFSTASVPPRTTAFRIRVL